MLIVITPAEVQPVSTATLKAHLRLNDTSEDTLLADWIAAAADLFTDRTGYVPTETGLRLTLDGWPSLIRIPRHPITLIDAVQYLDEDGTWQDLEGWTADLDSVPARIILPDSLPALHDRQLPKVRADFTAGHADADDVPALAAQGIRLLAAHWYKAREAYGDAKLSEVPEGFRHVCDRFKTGIIADQNGGE